MGQGLHAVLSRSGCRHAWGCTPEHVSSSTRPTPGPAHGTWAPTPAAVRSWPATPRSDGFCRRSGTKRSSNCASGDPSPAQVEQQPARSTEKARAPGLPAAGRSTSRPQHVGGDDQLRAEGQRASTLKMRSRCEPWFAASTLGRCPAGHALPRRAATCSPSERVLRPTQRATRTWSKGVGNMSATYTYGTQRRGGGGRRGDWRGQDPEDDRGALDIGKVLNPEGA